MGRVLRPSTSSTSRPASVALFLAVAFTNPTVTGVLLLSLSLAAIGAKCLWNESHPEHHFPYVLILAGGFGTWLWWRGVYQMFTIALASTAEDSERDVAEFPLKAASSKHRQDESRKVFKSRIGSANPPAPVRIREEVQKTNDRPKL